MKKILISIVSFISISLPCLLFAADANLGYFSKLIKSGTGILKNLLVLLISFAVVWFIWNVVKYTLTADDEEKKAAARSQMIWGIVAIAVSVSVWGLVGILQNAFGLNQGVTGAGGGFESMIPVAN